MAETKPVRIDEDLIPIIQAYVPNGSMPECIRAMVKELKRLQEYEKVMAIPPKPYSEMKGVSFAVPEMEAGQTKEFWKRLRKEVDAAIDAAQRGF
jgi:hypothetical protein